MSTIFNMNICVFGSDKAEPNTEFDLSIQSRKNWPVVKVLKIRITEEKKMYMQGCRKKQKSSLAFWYEAEVFDLSLGLNQIFMQCLTSSAT